MKRAKKNIEKYYYFELENKRYNLLIVTVRSFFFKELQKYFNIKKIKSNFTKKISPLLNKKIRSISTFFETLKNDNSMIYSNDKNINLIWRWVFYKESIHVYKDETMKVLIIQ
uniref:Uncharacterized protein n=1 Tax=Pithovirus LCPAC104 TaxID=2506589 RepID=A0A481Z473_9VIRU|nr:MAG: hypothetical protein LCPAC104_01920 [Pithovirus LCPAC104]